MLRGEKESKLTQEASKSRGESISKKPKKSKKGTGQRLQENSFLFHFCHVKPGFP